MRKTFLIILIFLSATLFLTSDVIKKIVIEGNKKVSRDTFLFYIKSKVDGEYSPDVLRKDFLILWKTGFFKNIKLEEKDIEGGKEIKFIVVENPLITSIKYETGKKIKKDDIEEKLQENSIVLAPFSYYNPSKVKKVETVIKDLLHEKSYNDGKVEIVTTPSKGGIDLVVKVEQGPKTRIGSIVFPGLNSKSVSSGYLRGGMKNNKVHGFLSAITSKDVYNKEKMEEDLGNVKLKLQQKGYLEAKIGRPVFSRINKLTLFGKLQNMMKIAIPVDLGPQYKLGKVDFDGNKIIRTDFLKTFITLKKDKLYDYKKRNKIIEEIQKFYGAIGYFYAQVAPEENLDPIKKIADLTIRIRENDIAYVGKLEFIGNTFTKDKVIRREWLLREGLRFNTNALENSIRRMKQLGLVTVEKMPEIKPDPDDPQKINMKIDVKELNRQMINFNVGYSGYDGWFVGLGYSTQNFLGLGESFTLNIQTGTRTKNYRLAFTEPHLFHIPASLGFDVFKQSFRYPGYYTREGAGFNIMSSFRFWRFWGSSLVYSFEDVSISDVNENIDWSNSYSFYYYSEGKRVISSLSPTLYYSTVDSPIFPTSGTKYLFNYRYSGGILGGDIDMHKMKFEWVKFQPLWKKHTLGMHAVFQSIIEFGENPVPFYEKIYLGGERSIRGFDIMRIGPRDENGYVQGGTKAFYINLEYQIPITKEFSFNFFYDLGNSYNSETPISLKDVYASMGMELKIFIPMLNVPFRLIFAYNPRILYQEDSHITFKFAVGPSFY
ncbi:MAG: outer membrane protein assembly factor BamA [Acidobacteriota bacterium]